MPVKTIRQALNEALVQEMRRDPRVIVIGEDVAGGAGTEGGRDAVWRRARRHQGADQASSAKAGSSTRRSPSPRSWARPPARRSPGLRPVAELMFSDFLGVCFDQIFNQAAKFRYMFGGKAQHAAGDPHDDRRRPQRRGTALAKPVSHLHLGAGPEGASCRRMPMTPRGC